VGNLTRRPGKVKIWKQRERWRIFWLLFSWR
jgi:hypothetical protein